MTHASLGHMLEAVAMEPREHGIRLVPDDQLQKLMKRAFRRGMRATGQACLAELNRRAKRDQVTVRWPDGSIFSGPDAPVVKA